MSDTSPCALPAPAASRSATWVTSAPSSLNCVIAVAASLGSLANPEAASSGEVERTSKPAAEDVRGRDASLRQLLDTVAASVAENAVSAPALRAAVAQVLHRGRGLVRRGLHVRHRLVEVGGLLDGSTETDRRNETDLARGADPWCRAPDGTSHPPWSPRSCRRPTSSPTHREPAICARAWVTSAWMRYTTVRSATSHRLSGYRAGHGRNTVRALVFLAVAAVFGIAALIMKGEGTAAGLAAFGLIAFGIVGVGNLAAAARSQ